jgi:hypothetical protein
MVADFAAQATIAVIAPITVALLISIGIPRKQT